MACECEFLVQAFKKKAWLLYLLLFSTASILNLKKTAREKERETQRKGSTTKERAWVLESMYDHVWKER